LGYEVSYERPVAVGNKVVVGLTVTKTASRTATDISVQPFMSKIEHIMYIASITNFVPLNLALATDASSDDIKYPIVMDSIKVEWNLGNTPTKFLLIGLDNAGKQSDAFGSVSTGGEIGKFLIIGSK